MNAKIKAGIIGATGYAGAELYRLLSSHKYVDIAAVSSVSFEGQKICEIYPAFNKEDSDVLVDADKVIEASDVIFASLPAGLSEEIAVKCLEGGKVLIDLGADFRLYDPDDYEKWYGKAYSDKKLHQKAVYALCELYRDEIAKHDIIGNPGCYPTSIGLALMPALKNNLVDCEHIIIDSKSGVTGAGRGLSQKTHYPDANEAFSAYKAAEHRHTPEIEQTLSDIAKKKVSVTFVPHLLPVNRGILSTIYVKATADFEKIYETYKETYKDEHFVRVLEKGAYANINGVRMSNFCDISLHFDKRTNTLIITSAIDNMVKGAAGQAIQNMNIRFGFDECEGLPVLACPF